MSVYQDSRRLLGTTGDSKRLRCTDRRVAALCGDGFAPHAADGVIQMRCRRDRALLAVVCPLHIRCAIKWEDPR